MSRLMEGLGVFFSVMLIIGGLYSFYDGIPYLLDNKPHNKVSEITDSYFYHGQISTVFFIKTESVGLFVADEPINVSVTTVGTDVRGIQLRFLGAGKYFPNNTAPPSPPSGNSSSEAWNQWEKEMQQYDESQRQNEESSADILLLTNDTDLTVTIPFENITLPNYPTFSGSIQNLTYSVGGQFSIAVTVTQANGTVVGYDMGDTSYILQNVIEVSPPETMLQIQSNYILTGLGWIGIGLSPLLASIALIWEIAKSHSAKRKTYDGDWE
jgi:hypothetical protein